MKKIIFLLLSLSLTSTVSGQILQPNQLKEALDSFNINTLQEKVYIVTDKEVYITGEKIWYKAFCIDASFHLSSPLSKVIYIELVDADGNPTIQHIVEISDGKGDNAMEIPIPQASGNYTLRAYTKWMRNFDPDFFFAKTIQIINPEASNYVKPNKDQSIESLASLDFFPEGGELVEGLKSIIAFKANDHTGNCIAIQGMIIENATDTISTFSSEAGYGKFEFTPKKDSKYTVFAKSKNGEDFEFPFPKVKESGLVMRVENQQNSTVSINFSASPTFQNRQYILFIQNKNRFVAEKTIFIGTGLNLELKKEELLEGINQVTLFDLSLTPLAERLVFQEANEVSLEIIPANKIYGNRKKVTLEISATSPNGKPLAGEFALSVTKHINKDFNNLSINTYFNVFADLKGDLHNAVDFLKSSASAKKATDLIMMTHGWRRFDWGEILKESSQRARFIPEYNGWILSGKVVQKGSDTPVPNKLIFLSFAGKSALVQLHRTNADGQFNFVVNGVYDEKDVVIQLMPDANTSQTQIIIDEIFNERKIERNTPVYTVSDISKLNNVFVNHQIEEAYFLNKGQDNDIQHLNHHFYDYAHSVYDMSKYNLLPVMDEILREIAKGVYRKKTEQGLKFMIFNDDINNFINMDPLVLLDGVPAFKFTDVQNFDTKKLEKLEVYRKKFFLNRYTFGGILHLVSKKGDLSELDLPASAKRVYLNTLEPKRVFYSPTYSNANINSRIPDFRNTLYWNPTVLTDASGKATVSFYTADDSGTYEISLEGVAIDGTAGSALSSFEVKSRVE